MKHTALTEEKRLWSLRDVVQKKSAASHPEKRHTKDDCFLWWKLTLMKKKSPREHVSHRTKEGRDARDRLLFKLFLRDSVVWTKHANFGCFGCVSAGKGCDGRRLYRSVPIPIFSLFPICPYSLFGLYLERSRGFSRDVEAPQIPPKNDPKWRVVFLEKDPRDEIAWTMTTYSMPLFWCRNVYAFSRHIWKDKVLFLENESMQQRCQKCGLLDQSAVASRQRGEVFFAFSLDLSAPDPEKRTRRWRQAIWSTRRMDEANLTR